jgi:hypothetical protein
MILYTYRSVGVMQYAIGVSEERHFVKASALVPGGLGDNEVFQAVSMTVLAAII